MKNNLAGPSNVILVPDDKEIQNIFLQSVTMAVYVLILIFAFRNTFKYVIRKQRYKLLPVVLLYVFGSLICVTRIVQHCISFTYLQYTGIWTCNEIADGFSVCVGVSQVLSLAELLLTIWLFKIDLCRDT
jgi:uncharacterized membrane protein HdeD (DUF308 family)